MYYINTKTNKQTYNYVLELNVNKPQVLNREHCNFKVLLQFKWKPDFEFFTESFFYFIKI